MTEKFITISQCNHINKLNYLDPLKFAREEFITERARGAYIAAVCRPDCTYAFSKLSQATDPSEKDVEKLKNAVHTRKEHSEQGLRFVPLDTTTVKLAVFVDAGFATNADLTSQLGYINVLINGEGKSNISHYESIKSRRVTRSVPAAELFAMTDGFDVASTVRLALNDIFERAIPMKFYTDSRSLLDCLTTISSTSEKRLLIDLRILRESYERREITELFWIPTSQNPADAITKLKACNVLRDFLENNFTKLTPNDWIERNVKDRPKQD